MACLILPSLRSILGVPSHHRGTLEALYKHIEQDLTEGLQDINSANYGKPKYHFTAQAAHAFAARFYLYARQYAKAIEHADAALGSNPRTDLRDWTSWSKQGLSGNDSPTPISSLLSRRISSCRR